MEVNVDTLFMACVEGREDDLRTLCAQGHAHFLNEMIENPDNHNRFTMVYAYLERVEGKPDYNIMQALYDCGADFDCQLICGMEDGSTKYIRLLHIVIQIWKNNELAKWLIEHETNVNVDYVLMKNGKVHTRQTLLKIELDPSVYDDEVLVAMILAGVDVWAYCDYDYTFGSVLPLYVAIAMNRNVDQAAALILGGAKPDFIVTERNQPERSFIQYCQLCDRNSGEHYLQILDQATRIAASAAADMIVAAEPEAAGIVYNEK